MGFQKGDKPPERGKGRSAAFLFSHINHTDGACLIWPYSRIPKGYGMLGYEGRQYYAHRFMCEMVHGPAPVDKPQALHSCGNGHLGCVNPRHLSWGTNSQNQVDRGRHGRPTGSTHGARTKLRPLQIEAIRALKGVMTQVKIAETFGIKVGSVEYWHRHDRPPAPLGKNSRVKRASY